MSTSERTVNELEQDMLNSIEKLYKPAEIFKTDLTIDTEVENQLIEYATYLTNASNEELRSITLSICVDKLKSFDKSTYIHSIRVSIICMIIGKLLKLNNECIIELGLAGLLHDIGKKFIPIKIINKTDRLNEMELDIIHSHPAMSAYYIDDKYSDISDNVVYAVYQHHEKLDGSGYPRGLSGDNVCTYARILTIADIFDAYNNSRSYHQARTIDQTVEFIKNEHGLDRELVDIFISHLDSETGMIKY